jgi:hypothetical protein
MHMNSLLPAYEVVMSDCLIRFTGFYKATEKSSFQESLIEAITNFRKVRLEMFFRDTTVRTSHYGFDIGNDSMNSREKLSCSFWISRITLQ